MRNKKSRWKNAYIYLSYLLLITSVVTGISLSRYSKIVSGSDTAMVAKIVVKYVPVSAALNGNPVADLSGGISLTDLKQGDVLVYNFDVRNYDGTSRTQVAFRYKITISFNPSVKVLPLTYTLSPSSGESWTSMGLGSDESDSYTLTVTWPAASGGVSNQAQEVLVTVDYEQVD